MTLDTWLSAARGDASGLWLLSVMSQLVFPDVQVKGDVAAVARADASFATQYFASVRGRGTILGAPGTDFLWAGGRLAHAWPAAPDENEYNRVRDSNVETLLIGAASISRRRRRTPRASSCPTSRTAIRSCSATSGTRTTSGPTSPPRAAG